VKGATKSHSLRVTAGFFAFLAMSTSATTHYVNANSLVPVPPYTNWTTAAATIQEAVDVALAGDEIIVTNGVYQTGGREVHGSGITNRVAVDKPLTVRSVNGPAVTIIQGSRCLLMAEAGLICQMTGAGETAVRCVYLTNGASLSGFTLTNGAAVAVRAVPWEEGGGGGVLCGPTAVVSNCIIVGNSAVGGGGGAFSGTLNNCSLKGNSAIGQYGYGGGACETILKNCALTGNSADSGGGAFWATLNNCTLTGNSANHGGGVNQCTLNNCIVSFNKAPDYPNHDSPKSMFNYSCTVPLPASGVSNISVDPQLASASHLSADSPCRAGGSSSYANGADIDGEAWLNPPSIGCDEYHAGAVTGALTAAIVATYTNVAVNYQVGLTAVIEGRASASSWDFGDGPGVTNRPFVSHAWVMPGDYAVILRAYNESHSGGVYVTQIVHVTEGKHYVSLTGTNPLPPYVSWATAATNIQDALDVATVAGSLVLVSNGVYATGGRAVQGPLEVPFQATMTNRVVVAYPVTLRSVNGPQFTIIQGRQVPGTTNGDDAIRCVYLTNGASLSGFTITNGGTKYVDTIMDHPEADGGGVFCTGTDVVVSNCVVTGNSASLRGGGAYRGTLYDCTLSGNSVTATEDAAGGGAAYSTLNNCTLRGNSSVLNAGGAMGSTLNNCVLSGNTAAAYDSYGGGACFGTLNNCTLIGNSAGHGGGATYGTLNNCTLIGNSASVFGGGAESCYLNNCTLVGNSADSDGGGVMYGTLYNSVVYYNTAPEGENFYYSDLTNCCTAPEPGGIGNITNAPLFVDYAGGNMRLQSNSPCINTGTNAYAAGSTDLDGRPRIVGGTVDIGAYEFQPGVSGLFIGWLQRYSLPTDGSADYTDSDGDGLNNWQEWRCDTVPTNSLSALRLLTPMSGAPGLIVRWQSVSSRNYFLERGTDLGAQPPFLLLKSNIVGQAGTTTFMDTNAAGVGPFFYRVGVQE
jgi:hypothetical protein